MSKHVHVGYHEHNHGQYPELKEGQIIKVVGIYITADKNGNFKFYEGCTATEKDYDKFVKNYRKTLRIDEQNFKIKQKYDVEVELKRSSKTYTFAEFKKILWPK